MTTTQPSPIDVPPPPRELPRWFFVRRMQALAFSAVFFSILGVVLLAVPITISGHLPPGPDWTLDQQSRVAPGEILSLEYKRHVHINSRSPWKVGFAFQTHKGRTIRATGYTFDDSIQDKKLGDVIDVEYDPERPEHARPAGGSCSIFPWWTYPLFGWPLLIGLGMLIPLWRAVRRKRRLLSYGEATMGEVVGVDRRRYIHFGSKNPYDIRYAFSDLMGEQRRGQERTYDYAWAESLHPGDPLHVIYDPNEPCTSALWVRQPTLEENRENR